MNLYIDYGGTNFRYCFNNKDSKKLKTLKSKDIDLLSFLDHIIIKKSIKKVAISFAGYVNKGKIISSPNIDIKPINLKKHLLNNYGVKLFLDNDLSCAALAEQKIYKAKNMAVFYIGTGFGSAFISNGKLIKGANNLSAEIGHIPFQTTPFLCGCGRNDCLELSVSGSGIAKWCGHFNILQKYATLENLEKLDTKESNIILENFYKGLAQAFHTSLNLFDYDLLVLGGSLGKNENIKKFLQKEFKKSAFHKKNLEIKISTLKEGSLEGAKLLL